MSYQSVQQQFEAYFEEAKFDGLFDPPHKIGGRVLDILKNLLGSIDLSALSKDDFLKAVSSAYDTVIAPLFPSAILNSIVKSLVMSFAGHFYDEHTKPAVPSVSPDLT